MSCAQNNIIVEDTKHITHIEPYTYDVGIPKANMAKLFATFAAVVACSNHKPL